MIIKNREELVRVLQQAKEAYIEVYVIHPTDGYNSTLVTRSQDELAEIENYIEQVVRSNKVEVDLELQVSVTNSIQEPVVDFLDFNSQIVFISKVRGGLDG